MFVLIVDLATRAAWANDPAFLDVRALVQRHPQRYSVRFIVADQLAALVSAALAEEGGGGGGDGAQLDVSDEALNMFRPCSGVRLFMPLVLGALTQRFVYLDYDTVTLCDIRRLAAQFDAFGEGGALGLAREDPTGGALWDSWYASRGLPTAVPGGLNAGVLLVHIGALRREFGSLTGYLRAVLGIVRARGYAALVNATSDYAMALGDQDVLNVLAVQRPHLLHVLPDAWNVMVPGARQWRAAPAYQPPAPCLMHYNIQQWRHGASATTMGNSAFKYVQEWAMACPWAPGAAAAPAPAQSSAPPAPGSREALARLHSALDAIGLGRAVGHTGDLPQHVAALLALLRGALPPPPPGGLVLCEVGFNVGHAAATFLTAAAAAGARVAAYHAFELAASDPAVAAGAAAVQAAFPGTRLVLHPGDARASFPGWVASLRMAVAAEGASASGGPCDLVHVDGSHDHGAPGADLAVAAEASRADGRTLVLVNDCGCLAGSGPWCAAPEAAFEAAVAAGSLLPLREGAKIGFVSKGTCAARGVRPGSSGSGGGSGEAAAAAAAAAA